MRFHLLQVALRVVELDGWGSLVQLFNLGGITALVHCFAIYSVSVHFCAFRLWTSLFLFLLSHVAIENSFVSNHWPVEWVAIWVSAHLEQLWILNIISVRVDIFSTHELLNLLGGLWVITPDTLCLLVQGPEQVRSNRWLRWDWAMLSRHFVWNWLILFTYRVVHIKIILETYDLTFWPFCNLGKDRIVPQTSLKTWRYSFT